jgi:hypothetical protein
MTLSVDRFVDPGHPTLSAALRGTTSRTGAPAAATPAATGGNGRPGSSRTISTTCAAVLGLIAVLAVNLRLSWTFPANSDGAGNALQAWQMLHGNPLLRGWLLSDVSFYTTELPEYALVETVHGLNAGDIHIAAAITLTLATALAALLATRPRGSRVSPAAAAVGACIAAGIMIGPQLGDGIPVFLSSPDHIGTSVPIMLAWLVLDRFRLNWRTAAVVSFVLWWTAVADQLVVYAAVLPLVVVVVIRVVQARIASRQSWRAVLVHQGDEVILAVGALAAVIGARLALGALSAVGGVRVESVAAHLASPGHIIHHNVPVIGQGLLLLFGADVVNFPVSVGTVAHLAGVGVVLTGIVMTLWRFLPDRDLVAQLLIAGIAANLAAFLVSTSVSQLPTMREIDMILPFSAALAGRQLGPVVTRLRRPARLGAVVALAAIAAGYVVGVAREITLTVPPANEQRLVAWLEARHLYHGLSGYWESNVITLTSGGKVTVRLVDITHRPDLLQRTPYQAGAMVLRRTARVLVDGSREDDSAWYGAQAGAANFVVLYNDLGYFHSFTDRAAVVATFGEPARTYRFKNFRILVWPHDNLLDELGPAPGAG